MNVRFRLSVVLIVSPVIGLMLTLGIAASPGAPEAAAAPSDAPPLAPAAGIITMSKFIYLPVVYNAETCPGIPSETYGALMPAQPPSDRPAAVHADLNLGWRGYVLNPAAQLGFKDYGGPTDANAPQFPSLFGDNRTPSFTSGYQVYNWDWGCNCRGAPIGTPDVTLLGMGTVTGEIIHVPSSGYSIGSGYEALVLYADTSRITLKYTIEDNVIYGYTIHMENVCTEPRLLQLYRDLNAGGRRPLPALRAGQGFGRAMGAQVMAAIQDTGTWMDPRSRKDWWQGR